MIDERLPPPPRVPGEAVDPRADTVMSEEIPTWLAKPLGRWAFAAIVAFCSLVLGSVGGAGVERFATAQDGVITENEVDLKITAERDARETADAALASRTREIVELLNKLDDKLDTVTSNQSAIKAEIQNLKDRGSERRR